MMLGLAQMAKNHPGDRSWWRHVALHCTASIKEFLITGTDAPRMEPTEIIEPREGKALYTMYTIQCYMVLHGVYYTMYTWCRAAGFYTALPPL